jgi:hypothetical protein
MSSRRTEHIVRYAVAMSAVVGVVVLGAGVAQAETTHLPLFQLAEIPAVGPHGESVAQPGPLGQVRSMAVDSGHLWTVEGELGRSSRVDEFDAVTGAFLSQPVAVAAPTSEEVNKQVTTGYGEGYGSGIAVAHSHGEAALYVGGRLHGAPVVSILSEAGALESTWNGHATPAHAFGEVTDVAVDNSSSPLDTGKGDVIVTMARAGKVVDIFHPEANGEERYVGQITGVSPSEPFTFPWQVAIDEATGDLLVLDKRENNEHSVVDVFEPNGLGGYVFVRKLGGPPPSGSLGSLTSFAVDSGNGEVFVTENAPAGDYVTSSFLVDELNAAGGYIGHTEDVPIAEAIAVDPVSHDLYVNGGVYGPDVVIPDVTTAPFSNLKPTSVTLNGMVNPDGAGNATCEFEWGPSTAFGKVAPCSEEVRDGESPVAVHAALSGIERNVTYYYRLRATNANGTNRGEPLQDQQFSPPGAILREEFVSTVGATSANFGATIDPGATPTSYYFQYGPSSEYGQNAPAPPGEAIGSGTTDVQVPSLGIQGLSPGTLYHYRVVAVSEIVPGELETLYGADRTFVTQAARGSFMPVDGRQWQLVSPPQKLGALIEGSGARAPIMQASAEGDAIAYRASSATESEPHGFATSEMVLSARGIGGWASQDISPPHDHPINVSESAGHEFGIFSEDLSRAALQPTDSSLMLLSPEANESTAYLRSDYLNGSVEDLCTSSCYRPLVTGKAGFANVPSGTVFGEEPNGRCELPECGPRFQGASPDLSHVVLSSPVQLTSTPAPAGGEGLYEWSEGSLQLLDVLPQGEEGPAVLAGVGYDLGVRHSVSDDGERVVMEGGAKGRDGLYLRDVAARETIRLDVPQGGSGPGEVTYMDASSDASRIFFLDTGRLMADSSPSGEDLYEYNLNAPVGSRLSDLTVDPHLGESADVQMMLGASKDGSYVYFAASGALAPGAVEGECKAESSEINSPRRKCNLYVRHEGVTQLIAILPSSESYDWSRTLHAVSGDTEKDDGLGLHVRVSPNGRWLAFMSAAELTGYDTHDAVSGQSDIEVYLYRAPAGAGEAGALICASCDPTGARPVGAVPSERRIYEDSSFANVWMAGSVTPWTGFPVAGEGGSLAVHQPRYLSDSGRLFFDSAGALVPQDVDGTEDVYEYEPEGVPAGEHACSRASTSGSVLFKPAQSSVVEGRVEEESAGCVGLISSGTSNAQSWFLDASETGGDVFFITQARLAAQDGDTAFDVYDAHECTGASPCSPVVVSPPPCDTEASCKAAPEPQPSLYGLPSSATFSGAGNLTLQPASPAPVKATVKKAGKCPKGKTRNKHGQCVQAKAKAKKKQKKAKKPAHSDRRTSR